MLYCYLQFSTYVVLIECTTANLFWVIAEVFHLNYIFHFKSISRATWAEILTVQIFGNASKQVREGFHAT